MKTDRITVRGFATDTSGIASVWVNGRKAAVTSVVADNQTIMSSQNSKTDTYEKNTEVNWEVEISIPGGESEILVEVIDGSGETNAEADLAEISFTKVPTFFGFNESTQNLLGEVDGKLVDYNLFTEEQVIYGQIDSLANNFCYSAEEDSFYSAELNGSDRYTFIRRRLSGNAQGEVIHHQGRNTEMTPYTEELFCDIKNNNLYFLVHHSVSGEVIDKSIVYKLSLAETPTWTVLHETSRETPDIINHMTVANDTILAYLYESNDIASMSIHDGSLRVIYEDYPRFTTGFVQGSTLEEVYLVNLNGVDKIDPAKSRITKIGYVDSGDSLEFAQPRSAVLDSINYRLLIGDSSLDSIIAIDLHTGERSLALTGGIGSGPKLIAPSRIALNESLTLAYVIDGGGNAAEKVFEMDLITGSRTIVGDIDVEFNPKATGIAFDEKSNILYASNEDSIFKINLSTNETTVVASDSIGLGVTFKSVTGISLDANNKKLFFSDDYLEQIVAVDLETNKRSLVSGATRGAGDKFENINSLAFNSEQNILYVTNQSRGEIQIVDVPSGSRSPVNISCNNFGKDESLKGISYDSARNELLLIGEGVVAVDIDSGICIPITNVSPFDIHAISNDRLFTLKSGGLILLDRISGEEVVISK